jgi:hypothetical protein
MKTTKRYILGMILIFSAILFSGLGFTQDELNADAVIKYFVSFYAPYGGAREAGFTMNFGNELNPKEAFADENELPQRTYLK